MENKKLKDLLKESNVWDRKFGESLPTLADTTKAYAEKNKMNEAPGFESKDGKTAELNHPKTAEWFTHYQNLKNIGCVPENVDVWEEGLVWFSQKIREQRKEYLKEINNTMKNVNKKHKTNKETHLDIIGIKTNKQTKKQEIKENKEKDFFTKKTNSGPHTDKINYTINKRDIKTKASQGEKNLFFSILKKAESKIIKQEIKKDPIILLDDIFSKLDSSLRDKLGNTTPDPLRGVGVTKFRFRCFLINNKKDNCFIFRSKFDVLLLLLFAAFVFFGVDSKK